MCIYIYTIYARRYIRAFVYMYVCMCICMYVSMHVCIYTDISIKNISRRFYNCYIDNIFF